MTKKNNVILLLIFWNISFFVHIMTPSEAQVARLIVESSVFEAFPARNPFEPQIPREEPRVEKPGPVVPVEIPVHVAEPVAQPQQPPPPIIVEPVRDIPKLVQPLPALAISGLTWNTDRPQAIINGHIVGIGDMVAGVKIIDIRRGGITVLFQGRTEEIKTGR